MNTKELIKRYWFVGVVGLALLVFVGVYAVDAYKNRDIIVNSKQSDGKYVAYSIDDDDVFADDLYTSLYEINGLSQAVVAYERAIFDAGYETTDEMEQIAATSTANILSRYSQEYVLDSLRSMGYTKGVDDIKQYYIDSQKQEILVKDYILANQDKYLKDELGTDGRIIYHILVKCDVTPVTDEEGNVTAYEANPTDEQKEKLAKILEELSDENNTFEYVAYSNSDDSSSSNGGYLGLVNEDNKSQYDKFFAETAMSLKEGEVSEPIVSQYGYHIIKNAASSVENIVSDYYYLSSIENANPTLAVRAIMEKGEELGFKILNEDLKTQIETQLAESEENQ